MGGNYCMNLKGKNQLSCYKYTIILFYAQNLKCAAQSSHLKKGNEGEFSTT